jgi:hypothetical protein
MLTTTERPGAPPRRPRDVARRLEAASWGVFFVWAGYALLTELPIGVGLIGVGAIALITQAVRKWFALPFERFWILVGLGFVTGGLWNVFSVEIPFASILLFGAGVLLLAAALLRKGGDEG